MFNYVSLLLSIGLLRSVTFTFPVVNEIYCISTEPQHATKTHIILLFIFDKKVGKLSFIHRQKGSLVFSNRANYFV